MKLHFDQAYNGKRAPFPVYIHPFWLRDGNNVEQLQAFAGTRGRGDARRVGEGSGQCRLKEDNNVEQCWRLQARLPARRGAVKGAVVSSQSPVQTLVLGVAGPVQGPCFLR